MLYRTQASRNEFIAMLGNIKDVYLKEKEYVY